MERAPKSRNEIELLVLHELRTSGECDGAIGVSICGCDSFGVGRLQIGPNWTIAAFNAGTANDYECERALMGIVSRLQGFYELVQKH